MLGGVIGSIVASVANNAVAEVGKAFQAHANKQISIAEVEAKVKEVIATAFAEIEKAAYEAIAKTFDSFTKALVQSKLMQVTWASVVFSQLLVLVWHQVGIPFVIFMGYAKQYPSSGTTVEWAYLLLGLCLGAGPMVLRSGPGAGDIAGRLKDLVKR